MSRKQALQSNPIVTRQNFLPITRGKQQWMPATVCVGRENDVFAWGFIFR
jgi:hypothetical protein